LRPDASTLVSWADFVDEVPPSHAKLHSFAMLPNGISIGACACLIEWALRIGLSTNSASSADAAAMPDANMNTACQLPVAAVMTLLNGTSKAAVPFAVYSRPALVAANFGPKV
jgi:hypothetical protein